MLTFTETLAPKARRAFLCEAPPPEIAEVRRTEAILFRTQPELPTRWIHIIRCKKGVPEILKLTMSWVFNPIQVRRGSVNKCFCQIKKLLIDNWVRAWHEFCHAARERIVSAMPYYISIDCPTNKLIPFLADFAHVPHIAVVEMNGSNIHYLGFNHFFPITAVRAFARKNKCSSNDLTEVELLHRFPSPGSVRVIAQLDFDLFVDRNQGGYESN